MTKPKQADRFDLYFCGGMRLDLAANECGLPIPLLSNLRNGKMVASAKQITALSKWTGRSEREIMRMLNSRVLARTKELEAEIA